MIRPHRTIRLKPERLGHRSRGLIPTHAPAAWSGSTHGVGDEKNKTLKGFRTSSVMSRAEVGAKPLQGFNESSYFRGFLPTTPLARVSGSTLGYGESSLSGTQPSAFHLKPSSSNDFLGKMIALKRFVLVSDILI